MAAQRQLGPSSIGQISRAPSWALIGGRLRHLGDVFPERPLRWSVDATGLQWRLWGRRQGGVHSEVWGREAKGLLRSDSGRRMWDGEPGGLAICRPSRGAFAKVRWQPFRSLQSPGMCDLPKAVFRNPTRDTRGAGGHCYVRWNRGLLTCGREDAVLLTFKSVDTPSP
jgi:hypothetical protein